MPHINELARACATAALGALVLWGSAGQALAQDAAPAAADAGPSPICANRPGKGTPTCVMDPGQFQIEVGAIDWTTQKNQGVTTDAYAVANFNLRMGIAPGLEGQFSLTPYSQIRQHGKGASSTVSGVGDITLTLRQALTKSGAPVSVSVQPFIVAPTGANGISGGAWQGGVVAPISLNLTPEIGLALSPQITIVPNQNGGGHHVAYTGVIGLSRGFGELTLGGELWANVNDDPSSSVTQASVDLTAAWIPKKHQDTQFDAGLNFGLNSNTPDVEVYVGISKRF